MLLLPFFFTFMATYTLTSSGCRQLPDPAAYGMPFEEVTFPSDDIELEGYLIPGESQATVILASPFRSDHGGQLEYGKIFYDYGLSVFSMSARTCYEHKGTFGYLEGDDVSAAYQYLTTRDDVDAERVSVHGFSAAGAAAIFGAARTPQIRAISAMGNYHNYREVIAGDVFREEPLNWLYSQGAVWGYEFGAGIDIDNLTPINVLDEIAPRPILFVYGTSENIDAGRQMFAVAESHAQMWEPTGSTHGSYLRDYPEETRTRVGGFHYEHLIGTDATIQN